MSLDPLAILSLVQRALPALCLLVHLDRPTSPQQIAALLARSPSTARRHLALLAEHGLVTRSPAGWVLSPKGRDFATRLLGEPRSASPEIAQTSPRYAATTATARFKLINSRSAVVAVEAGKNAARAKGKPAKAENPVQRKQGKPAQRGVSDQRAMANLRALREEGVGENELVRQVCRMAHVSPKYIRAQADRLRREGRFRPGLLLYVVRSHDPMPRTPDEEDRRRYVSGPYAKFIEH